MPNKAGRCFFIWVSIYGQTADIKLIAPGAEILTIIYPK
jgi:hypothetical protein